MIVLVFMIETILFSYICTSDWEYENCIEASVLRFQAFQHQMIQG